MSIGGKEAVAGEPGNQTILACPVDQTGAPQLTAMRQVPADDFKAVINRSRGVVPLSVPMLNERPVLRYASDKVLTDRELFQPHGMSIRTFELATPADIEQAFAELPATHVVLKKVNGTLTEGLYIEDRQRAREILEQELLPGGTRYLLQPAYDFTIAWPDSLRPYSEADTADLAQYATNTKPKELRMYFFYAKDAQTGAVQVDCFPVARTSLTGTKYMQLPSNWFCIDPASLPDFIAAKTEAAARSLGDKTDSKALFGCIDWGYGAIGDEEPTWVCIEGNFRAPYLLSSDKHPVVGPLLYKKFAALIDHLARQ